MSRALPHYRIGSPTQLQMTPGVGRLAAWLDEPARRLRRMLGGMPGFGALVHVSLLIRAGEDGSVWMVEVRTDEGCLPMPVAVNLRDIPWLAGLTDASEPQILAEIADCRCGMVVPLREEGEFLGFVLYGAQVPHFFDDGAREIIESYSGAFAVLLGRALDETSVRG